MDIIKEIESIRTDILDTIAKCECGDDCESVVFLKKIAGRLSSVSSCCRPLAAAPAASPTPDSAAPSAPVPSVPSVPSVSSNEAKLREAIQDLHRQLESMTLQRDQTFELFRRTVAKDYAEWRVVVKDKGRWLVSPHVFPGMTRKAAWDIAKIDRERYEDARPQIRICSDWSDADVCPIEESEDSK